LSEANFRAAKKVYTKVSGTGGFVRSLIEPKNKGLIMNKQTDPARAIGLEPPRFVNGDRLLLAGLRERVENLADIPALWQRALTYKTPKRVGTVDYGVCFNCTTDKFEYLAGFEVSDSSDLPAGLSCVTIPPQKYAVFSHHGHVSELCRTCDKIGKWLEQSDYEHAVAGADAPDFFERYGKEFDPQTGTGGMEVWIPIKA
jgi:AraC family transcriptional regulator